MIGGDSALRRLFLWGSLVATSILHSGCVVTPIEVKSDVVNPAEAGKHSVAVVPDPYTDDLTAANKLVDLVRKEMKKSGFRLSQSEDTAELVVIPHLTSSTSGAGSAKPVTPLATLNLINPNVGEPGMMQNGGALGELPLLEDRPAVPQERIQLIVMAVQLNDWRKALIVNQLKVPQVWRISVFAPTDFSAKGKEVTTQLVEAAGPRFAQLAKE